MKKTLFILFLSFICFCGLAQDTEWKVASSSISFKIKNAGIMVNGSFSGLSAAISFDPAKSFGNKIEASIDAATVNTSINSRDTHLKKEEYFSVDKFPKITMKASTFSKEADGKFKGFFTLTLKGTSNMVPVIFSFTETGNKAKLQGSFKINRLDYKVGESSWVLSNDVTINIELDIVK